MSGSVSVKLRKDTVKILQVKKQLLHRSLPELVEFAVFHMPNMPPKRKKVK